MKLAMISKLSSKAFLPRVETVFENDGVEDDMADNVFVAGNIEVDYDGSTDSDVDMVVCGGGGGEENADAYAMD